MWSNEVNFLPKNVSKVLVSLAYNRMFSFDCCPTKSLQWKFAFCVMFYFPFKLLSQLSYIHRVLIQLKTVWSNLIRLIRVTWPLICCACATFECLIVTWASSCMVVGSISKGFCVEELLATVHWDKTGPKKIASAGLLMKKKTPSPQKITTHSKIWKWWWFPFLPLPYLTYFIDSQGSSFKVKAMLNAHLSILTLLFVNCSIINLWEE